MKIEEPLIITTHDTKDRLLITALIESDSPRLEWEDKSQNIHGTWQRCNAYQKTPEQYLAMQCRFRVLPEKPYMDENYIKKLLSQAKQLETQ